MAELRLLKATSLVIIDELKVRWVLGSVDEPKEQTIPKDWTNIHHVYSAIVFDVVYGAAVGTGHFSTNTQDL
eukprot:14168799-Ditylum_brightwellii.AAC.1